MATKTRLVDLAGLAELLGVPQRQAYELYRSGRFPGVKLSRKYLRFDPADVLRAVKKGKSHEQSTT